MPPYRVALESHLSPSEAVGWLAGEDRPFALVGEWLGGVAVLGSDPMRVARADEDPFALLASQPELGGGDALVGGGWVGWLGYGLGASIEQLPPSPPAPVPPANVDCTAFNVGKLVDSVLPVT